MINKKENKKILLFPGEKYSFNRNLLPYNVFSFKIKTNQLISKKTSLIELNNKKYNENIEYIGKFYYPTIDDVVIGIITMKTLEYYKLDIGSSHESILNSIDFEGATKSTKPNLNIGDAVFSKVLSINKFNNTYLTCKSEDSKKTWSTGESTFGLLNGGRIYEYNRNYSWLLLDNNKIIERLKDFCDFELCIGMNGKIWIKSDKIENNNKIYKSIIMSFEKNNEEMERYLNKIFNQI